MFRAAPCYLKRLLISVVFLLTFVIPSILKDVALAQSAPLTFELGSEEIVFDWTVDRCEDPDIPDGGVKGFRDRDRRIHLISPHWNNRQRVGRDFKSIVHECDIILGSDFEADFKLFNDKEYIKSVYTEDGVTIYANVGNEHHGNDHVTDEDDSLCPGYNTQGGHTRDECSYYNNTFAFSDDGGKTYTHVDAPGHHLASAPHLYKPGVGPMGIGLGRVIKREGYYYRLGTIIKAIEEQERGTIILRSDDISDPKSWRCWDGDGSDDEVDGFTVELINPYFPETDGVPPEGFDPNDYVCARIPPPSVATFGTTFTYNSYLDKYILVSHRGFLLDEEGQPFEPFVYYLSDDLIHWSSPELFWNPPKIWGDNDPDNPAPQHGYPSLIDPSDPGFIFAQTDDQIYLYYTTRKEGLDRDLRRRPVTIIDDTPPTVEISAPSQPKANIDGLVSYTVTYSDAAKVDVNLTKDHVLLNPSGEVDVAEVSISVANHDDDTSTVTLSNIGGNGALGIIIAAGAASDAPGNENLESNPSEPFTVDNMPPAVEISAPSEAVANDNDTVSYTVTYSEAVDISLSAEDIELDTAETSTVDIDNVDVVVTGEGNTMRTVTLSNIQGDGDLGISIKAHTASDELGNESEAAGPSETFEVDNTPPLIEFSPPSVPITNDGPVSYMVKYIDADEVTLDPEEDVILIGNATGTISEVVSQNPENTEWKVTVSDISGEDSLSVRILYGTARDEAGNLALRTTSEAVEVDNTPAVVEIGPPSVAVTNDGPVEYMVSFVDAASVNFSEARINFQAIGNPAPEGEITRVEPQNETNTEWKVTVGNIVGDGTLAIRILKNSAFDAAGNSNDRTLSSPFTVDNMPPVLEISEPSVSETAVGPVTYDVTYTGAVSETIDLMGKVTLNKTSEGEEVFGEVSVSETGNPRIVTIDNISGIGKLGITINEGTASDAAGNPAPLAGPSMTFEVDDTDTDGDGDPDLDDEDDDNDGIDDTYEEAHSECLDPLQADDPDVDGDGDRLTLLEEFTINTNPCEADTDGDQIDDMLDGDPLIGDNVCSGSDEAVYIEKVEENEEVQCGAAISIEVSPDVDELGLLRLISPKVILNSGGVSGELLIDSSHPCQACGL